MVSKRKDEFATLRGPARRHSVNPRIRWSEVHIGSEFLKFRYVVIPGPFPTSMTVIPQEQTVLGLGAHRSVARHLVLVNVARALLHEQQVRLLSGSAPLVDECRGRPPR